MLYLTLFFEFFKVGLFSIGGGLASLPYLYALADKYTWFTPAMLADMIAVSESTPGPIGINMATYAGYSAAGMLGGVIASLGMIAPSFIIIMFVVKALDTFSENKYVKSAFYGLRPAVAALIATAALGVLEITVVDLPAFAREGLGALFNYKQLVLFILLMAASNIKKLQKLHPVWFIGAAAVVGAAVGF